MHACEYNLNECIGKQRFFGIVYMSSVFVVISIDRVQLQPILTRIATRKQYHGKLLKPWSEASELTATDLALHCFYRKGIPDTPFIESGLFQLRRTAESIRQKE